MKEILDDGTLDLLFRDARTRNAWHDETIPETLLRDVWNLAEFGPTSTNCSLARVVFVVSAEAKKKLTPCLIEGSLIRP